MKFQLSIQNRSANGRPKEEHRVPFLLFVLCPLFFAFCSSVLAQKSARQLQKVENWCWECHSKEKKEYTASIHEQRGIRCIDCHGGDPTKDEEETAMSPKAGFKRIPDQKYIANREIATLCASCHNDERMMTPYGLPTDQFDQYRISVHGTRLFENRDASVAVCTDCHRTHATLKHSDPRSSVYIANVPAMCAKRIPDEKLMKQYNLPADQYDKYVSSVHGKALLETRLTRGVPNCATCHGTHGAAPPGVEDVSKVCGQCHSDIRNYFNDSPHKKAMDEQKITECASCHNNHDIAPSTLEMFDTTCSRANCHAKNTSEFKSGQQIKTLIAETNILLGEARQSVAEAKEHGMHTIAYEFTLKEARTYIQEAKPVTHTLSEESIRQFTRKAMGAANKVKGDINHHFDSLKVRKLYLGFVWLFIFASVVALYLRKRRADRALKF